MASFSSVEQLPLTVYWCPLGHHGGARQSVSNRTQSTVIQIKSPTVLLGAFIPVSNNLHGNVLTPEVHTKTIVEKKFKYSKLLTQIKVCYRPVVVQFSLQFFIFAVYINSFRVEVNGVVEIFLSVFLVTFILVNLCYCYNKPNENNVSSSVFFFPGFLKCKTAATITFFKTRWRHLLPPKWYHVI